MTVYSWFILALWLCLVAVWTVAGRRAKPNARSGWMWRREIALRVAILAIIVITFRVFGFRNVVGFLRLHAVNRNPFAGAVGVALCAAGVGLAILARACLGRNWGMPMSQKENPQLVTTGPYAVIRHPIYTGVLFALLGSAIGQTIFWILPLLVSVPYFIYAARREEILMTRQFPKQYSAYKKRTKMLLPYVV